MSSESSDVKDTKFDKVLALKRKLEDGIWKKRTFLKGVEIGAFLGMFLIDSPFYYTLCVVLGAFALGLDFYFQYQEYKTHQSFVEIFD